MQTPLIISFYTENTPYQLEVLNLISSCREHGLEFEVQALSCRGSWELNCAQKPLFIRDKLKEKKRPLLWVDADAIFRKPPDFSHLKPFDFSVREVLYHLHDRRFRFQASTLFINYTESALCFADKWASHCQKKIEENRELAFLDQTSLYDLLPQEQSLCIGSLPLAYCKVFDTDAPLINQEEVVIELFQASRRFKHLIQ
ncbi:MAG: hypothetical protein RLZZ453_567 [Chlamydiota bacterium]|jgi:hypothetical protein